MNLIKGYKKDDEECKNLATPPRGVVADFFNPEPAAIFLFHSRRQPVSPSGEERGLARDSHLQR